MGAANPFETSVNMYQTTCVLSPEFGYIQSLSRVMLNPMFIQVYKAAHYARDIKFSVVLPTVEPHLDVKIVLMGKWLVAEDHSASSSW